MDPIEYTKAETHEVRVVVTLQVSSAEGDEFPRQKAVNAAVDAVDHAIKHFHDVGFVHEHAADLCVGYVDTEEVLEDEKDD